MLRQDWVSAILEVDPESFCRLKSSRPLASTATIPLWCQSWINEMKSVQANLLLSYELRADSQSNRSNPNDRPAATHQQWRPFLSVFKIPIYHCICTQTPFLPRGKPAYSKDIGPQRNLTEAVLERHVHYYHRIMTRARDFKKISSKFIQA